MIEFLGTIVGIIGIISSVYIYWKGRKDRKNTEVLGSLMNANYRISDDEHRSGHRRGRIKKNPDGTYSVAWEIQLTNGIQISEASAEVIKKDEREQNVME